MLFVAGTLDRSRPKGSPAMELKVIELSNTSTLAKQLEEEAKKSVRRSVYLPLVRGITPRALEVFDFAEQGLVTGSRDSTTVAPQALYLLNDPFVRQQARALADKLQMAAGSDEMASFQSAYRLALGRAGAREGIGTRQRISCRLRGRYGQADGEPARAAWTSFCHALLASAEFRYLR